MGVFQSLSEHQQVDGLDELHRCLKTDGRLSATFDYRNPAPYQWEHRAFVEGRGLISEDDIRRVFTARGTFRFVGDAQLLDRGVSPFVHEERPEIRYTLAGISFARDLRRMSQDKVHGRERAYLGDAYWVEDHAEIMARYLFAGRFAAGRRVLDAAIGTGYGAATLGALGASCVHGIDKDANAVSEAITRYSTPTISFAVDDCERLHTMHSPVDVVCSFETIEHLDDPEAFLAAVVRVLAPGGVFLCSTPDRSTTPPFVDGRPYNPYHRFEWYRDEFRGMLAEFFTTVESRSQVETFGYARRWRAVDALQRRLLLRLARRLPAWIGGLDLWTLVETLCDPNRRGRPGRRGADGAAARRDGQHSRDLPWRKSVSNGSSVPGLVSVVVVGHNNWPELEMAIASAVGQTYRAVEVIVVDNDSVDATSTEVPRRFGQRVRYVRQPNSGDGGGYNRGIAESTGEFVHLLDGDDVLSPTMIEKQVVMLEQDKSLDAVYGDVRMFLDEAGIVPYAQISLMDYDDLLAALIRADDNGYIIPSSLLFRRSTLERLGRFIAREGPWDDIWWQVDREFLLRAANAGCRLRYSPGALVFYRQHSKQMTQDVRGMDRGYAVLMERMAKTITREPYHGMLRSIRAQQLWGQAMSVPSSRTEALGKLRGARTADSRIVTPLRYALGVLAILAPGGAWAYRLQRRLRGLNPRGRL